MWDSIRYYLNDIGCQVKAFRLDQLQPIGIIGLEITEFNWTMILFSQRKTIINVAND